MNNLETFPYLFTFFLHILPKVSYVPLWIMLKMRLKAI